MAVDRELRKDNAMLFVAVGAFMAAVALAFTSLMISKDHDIAAGVLMMCAQFLTLTAAIFGIDYKWRSFERKAKGGAA